MIEYQLLYRLGIASLVTINQGGIELTDSEIYLDNAATTKPYDEVADIVHRVSRIHYGNPSSLHRKGLEAERLIEGAREKVACSINTDARNIFFTSGGTESNNLALTGYINANRRKGNHAVTSRIEHPSVLEILKNLESQGLSTDYVDVDGKGTVDIEMLSHIIRPETIIVSIAAVNNETGAIQDMKKVCNACNSKNPETVLHADAVQAYGKMRLFPEEYGIDLMSFSSHKIHGPKGIGALYVSSGIRIAPIVSGGGQEKGVRSGTENVSGIAGFAKAVEITFENMDKTSCHAEKLRKELKGFLLRNIGDAVLISKDNSSPYILNISFPEIRSEVILHHLEQNNIFISTGSACHSRHDKGSHVLKAMGLDKKIVEGALRFSFSSFNTLEQIKKVSKALVETYMKLRALGM